LTLGALLALTVVPFGVSAARLATARHAFQPFADEAAIELQTRAVGAHRVLLGPYSRFGFKHPGPALYYVLAVPYRLLGSGSNGILFGALLINAAAAVGLVLVGWRRGGFALATVVCGATLLLMRSLGGTVLRDPWNPYVTVLPFALTLLLAWAVAVGDAPMLPVLLGTATFVVQSHLGYAIPVAAALAVAVAGLVTHVSAARRNEDVRSPRWRVVLVSSAAVVAVMWLPVLGDELVGQRNVTRIVKYFTSHSGSLSWADASRVVALQSSWRPEWLTHPARLAPFGVVPSGRFEWPLLLVLALVVTIVAVVRRERSVVWMAATVGAGLAAGVVAVHGVVGLLAPYIVRWTWALGMALGVLTVWGGIKLLERTTGRAVRRAAAAVAVIAVVSLSGAATAGAFRASTPDADRQQALRSLSRQLVAHVPRDRDIYLVSANDVGGWTMWGLLVQLVHRGYHVRTSPRSSYELGRWWTTSRPDGRTHLVVVVKTPDELRMPALPEGRVVARWSRPYTAREQRHARRVAADVQRTRPAGDPGVATVVNAANAVATLPRDAVVVVETG
jgi:hypothetical protein